MPLKRHIRLQPWHSKHNVPLPRDQSLVSVAEGTSWATVIESIEIAESRSQDYWDDCLFALDSVKLSTCSIAAQSVARHALWLHCWNMDDLGDQAFQEVLIEIKEERKAMTFLSHRENCRDAVPYFLPYALAGPVFHQRPRISDSCDHCWIRSFFPIYPTSWLAGCPDLDPSLLVALHSFWYLHSTDSWLHNTLSEGYRLYNTLPHFSFTKRELILFAGQMPSFSF